MTPDEAAKKSGISTANWAAPRTEVPLVRAWAQSWAARPSAGRQAHRAWRFARRVIAWSSSEAARAFAPRIELPPASREKPATPSLPTSDRSSAPSADGEAVGARRRASVERVRRKLGETRVV